MKRILNILTGHKKKIIAIFLLIIIAYGASHLIDARGGNEMVVRVGEVIEDSFEQSIFATGTISVKDKQIIVANSSSIVEEIIVEPGQEVKIGQPLMKLETNDLMLRLAQAKTAYDTKSLELARAKLNLENAYGELEAAQKNLSRNQALYDMGAISKVELERAQVDFNSKEANVRLIKEINIPLLQSQLQEAHILVKQAQNALDKGQVLSSIEGTVLSIPVKAGQLVGPGTLLATLGDLNYLIIETGINEVDASEIFIGAPVHISAGGLFQNYYLGHIEYVAPIAELERTAQGELNQVRIRVALDEIERERLKPGFTVNLKVILSQREKATLVPYEAVTQRDRENVVFVVDSEGYVSLRMVELGLSNELMFEIIAGLKAGERVILNPGPQVNAGIKVKIQ